MFLGQPFIEYPWSCGIPKLDDLSWHLYLLLLETMYFGSLAGPYLKHKDRNYNIGYVNTYFELAQGNIVPTANMALRTQHYSVPPQNKWTYQFPVLKQSRHKLMEILSHEDIYSVYCYRKFVEQIHVPCGHRLS